jgi:hypothetical protein
MTWPLLSNGLSEGGRLSTCERQRTYTVDERHDGSCEAPQSPTRTRPMGAKATSSPTTLVSGWPVIRHLGLLREGVPLHAH